MCTLSCTVTLGQVMVAGWLVLVMSATKMWSSVVLDAAPYRVGAGSAFASPCALAKRSGVVSASGSRQLMPHWRCMRHHRGSAAFLASAFMSPATQMVP